MWAFLLLGRVRSPERLRYEQPGEWGALLGLDRCPCPRTLRRRTRYVADSEGLRAWVGALARHWCEDDPDTVATLFVDGHVQVYSGKGQLPKHFVSRQKLALPAAAGYWVHALGGAPLLCLHRQVDAGMVAEIWNGIVPQLQQMGLVAQGGETQQQEPCLTLVFDREGWSPRLFRELRAKGIAVVTWIKGAQAERWPDSEFREASIPVRAPCGPALLEGQLAERKPGPGQRQPALLTTHPSLAAAQAAGLLRSRWTQENYFKYQRAEFGLDTLPEHALVEVDEHAWVVNPAWREIDNALKKERNRVGHLRRKRALEADAQSATALALDAQIQASDGTIEGLVRARQTAAHHVQAGELSEAERLQVLPRALRPADGHPAHDCLPRRDGDGDRGRARAGQSRDRSQPAQVAVPRRRQPAPGRASRDAHRAPAAPADPRPGPGSGPLAGRAEPLPHRLPRHATASRLQNAIRRRVLPHRFPSCPMDSKRRCPTSFMKRCNEV